MAGVVRAIVAQGARGDSCGEIGADFGGREVGLPLRDYCYRVFRHARNRC